MAAKFKMAENWFFTITRCFELFCVLFLDLGLYYDQAYFIEDIFVRIKMTSDVQDGGRKSRELNFAIWQHFSIQSFAMS
jgi:hypothetical protein